MISVQGERKGAIETEKAVGECVASGRVVYVSGMDHARIDGGILRLDRGWLGWADRQAGRRLGLMEV